MPPLQHGVAHEPAPHSSGELDYRASPPVGGLSYVQGSTQFPLIHKTVGQCLDATAQRFPDREALVVLHEDVRMTFAQLKDQVGPNCEPSAWVGPVPRLP